ncbi:hypothetical protein CGC54_04890 [Capnocytophaga canimorsus]|uniref:CobQ/CobB/MinD/ParA nucleotide binding domain-containing protein n=1 Tax=Capnocytophaga canimorsus TaxID=28188 RepID=A0AAC9Z3L8_9FLAO|nr:hypothetical protein CGC54_04890 [Capnocytophaga canimorsus]
MKTKNTKFVSFSTQKGGVGKTTFTILLASLLHYRMGYNVASQVRRLFSSNTIAFLSLFHICSSISSPIFLR